MSSVPSDFTADEKIEMENMKIYKKDLLEDIQVNMHCAHSLTHSQTQINLLQKCWFMYKHTHTHT